MNHALLLHKLSRNGVSPVLLLWLESYLTDRHCVGRILNNFSDPFYPSLGEPQGSNLGPLLFFIFINEISTCVVNSNVLLFADYIKPFLSISLIDDSDLLQSDASHILNWCRENCLIINPEKTKVMSQ